MEMQVFISYAREDYSYAKRLFDSLRRRQGIVPWLDKKNILPGMDWESEVTQALQDSRFFIPLLSNNSVNKTGFVQKEIKEGLRRLALFPMGAIFVIPARLDESEPKDHELQRLNWVDLFPDWNAGIRQIVAAIVHERTNAIQRPVDSLLTISESIRQDSTSSWPRISRAEVLNHIKAKRSLAGTNLMGADFRNFDFSGCDLRGANLVDADLAGAILSGSRLAGANCERAKLISVKIDCADLWGVNLWHARLDGAIGWYKIASLEHTNFYETSGIVEKIRPLIHRFKTTSLPDYGSFFDYFRSKLGMTPKEIKTTFIWVNHEYFRSLLEQVEK